MKKILIGLMLVISMIVSGAAYACGDCDCGNDCDCGKKCECPKK